MKKLLFLLILILSVNQSDAQILKSYGLKVALTSATQIYNYSYPPWPGFGPDVKRRIGFNVALYAEWLNLPIVSIVSQMEYAQRGMGEEISITTASSPEPIRTEIRDKRLDYLSIPILAKLSFPIGIVTAYALIGPRIDFLLGYHDEFIVGNSIYEDFKNKMLGGSLGCGFSFIDLLPTTLSIEFRYNIDFDDSYDTNLLKVRNSAYDIWLGVAF